MFDKKEYNKKYYQNNKEKIKKCNKEYQQRNKDKCVNYIKKYYQKNKKLLLFCFRFQIVHMCKSIGLRLQLLL
ncbi:unnamed protein product [marine sediment metagenome]|uniref:Uncharacterized protein n=1 Tax=marine sediment metagenome TaxID=412755 RepID=X1CK93_9ZZZZ